MEDTQSSTSNEPRQAWSLRRFSIRAILILTTIAAIATWDLKRQQGYEDAIQNLSTVFPGGIAMLDEPTGLRRLQSKIASLVGIELTNRSIKTLEIFQEDPENAQPQKMSGEQIELLGKLPRAKHVFLHGFEFSLDEVAVPLRNTDGHSLDLSGCHLSNSSLTDLKLPFLRELRVIRCTGLKGLESVGKTFPLLESFSIEYSPQQGNFPNVPESLSGCRKLQSLSISGTSTTSEMLVGISKLTELRSISILESPITDKGLAGIEDLQFLQNINLTNSRVTNVTLARLAKLSELETVALDRCESITDDGLVHLAGKPLKKLLIRGNTNITDTSAEVLGSFNNLTDLWLDGTSIGRKTVQQISQHRHLKLLVLNSDQFHMDDLLPLASNSLIQIHIKDRRSPFRDSMLTPKDLKTYVGQ